MFRTNQVYFVSVGLMYGADTTVGYHLRNQSALIVGNAIGGAGIIAGSIHLMNREYSTC